jgi:uncharacterized membrane protein
MLESWVREITFTTSLVVEGFAAVIVAYAVAETIARLLLSIPRHSGDSAPQVAHNAKEEIRLRLGRWLAVALEMLLGADILRTAVAPTWSEIGQLAAIAAIRTALNFFLQREIDAAQARRSPQRAGNLPNEIGPGEELAAR